MLVYTLFDRDSSLRIGKYFPRNSDGKSFKAINILNNKHPIISWYTPDYPERIRKVKEEDLAKIASSVRWQAWSLECKEFLTELMIYYVDKR